MGKDHLPSRLNPMVRLVWGRQNQRVLCAPSAHKGTLMLNGVIPGLGVSVTRSANAPVSASVGGNAAPSAGNEAGMRSVVLATRDGSDGAACETVGPGAIAAPTSPVIRKESFNFID